MNDVSYKINELEKIDDGIKYEVTIKIPVSLGYISLVNLVIEENPYPLDFVNVEDGYAVFKGTVDLKTRALYHYYFSFNLNDKKVFYKKKNDDIYSVKYDEMFHLSVNFSVPEWAKGNMMYQIFVDRFYKGENSLFKEMPNRIIHKSWNEDILVGPNEKGFWNTDFYGGNLRGIIDKLDYIKSLGIGIIYLNPIMLSQSNHRYDTADYEKVDPYAGTEEDLKLLCKKAHELGIKIVLDAVFNHTGNDSKYFNQFGNFPELGAYQSKDSKYFNYYKKNIVDDKVYFFYWWQQDNLPVCDGYSKEWQDYIYGEGGVIDKWMSLGIDGLRLDVAEELETEFLEGIRRAVKRNNPDGFVYGEVWKDPKTMDWGLLHSGKGMDSFMNYQLIDALVRYFKYGRCDKLWETFYKQINDYPKDIINSAMTFTSTHDISRIINVLGSYDFNPKGDWGWDFDGNDREWQRYYRLTKEQYEFGKKLYKAYLYSLAFLPGNLSIYYGDEIGMQGMGNLFNRRPYPWNSPDNDMELLRFVQGIGKIRKNELFLRNAELELLHADNRYYGFKRIGDKEEALILVNRTLDKVDITIPEEYKKEDIVYRLNDSDKKTLDSNGCIVLKRIRDK